MHLDAITHADQVITAIDAAGDADTSAADAARHAIRSIRECHLTGAVVAAILETLASRVSGSNLRHMDDAQTAIEYIDDASELLGAHE